MSRRKRCAQCHTLVPVDALDESGACDACLLQLDLFANPVTSPRRGAR